MNAPATIPTQYGPYIPLSERISDFDDAFPLTDGWRVEIDVRDTFSMRSDFMELLKECVRNNVSLQELGIELPNQNSFVFTGNRKGGTAPQRWVCTKLHAIHSSVLSHYKQTAVK